MTKNFSLVVLSLNHLESTQKLLESVATTKGFYETILVDNGSEPDVVSELKALQTSPLGRKLQLRCTFNPENLGIASGRNQGAFKAKNEILVFLDNDTEIICSDWLEQIGKVYRTIPELGTVGGVLLNPDRTIQFAGGNVDSRAHVQFLTEMEPGLEATQTMFCLGACLSTPKNCWEQLGGFDNQFDPMDYEDIDYCLRATQLGRPSYVCYKCRLVHQAHTTTGTGASGFTRLRQYVRSGRRFRKKWPAIVTASEETNSRNKIHGDT